MKLKPRQSSGFFVSRELHILNGCLIYLIQNEMPILSWSNPISSHLCVVFAFSINNSFEGVDGKGEPLTG
ncbi:MAG: hypothetical protein ACI8ZO_001497 [Flavobacteriales bacterium]|jgi:hypothetical protein